MRRAIFVHFVRATFNAMDMLTPVEGATAVLKAFDEYEAAARERCIEEIDRLRAEVARLTPPPAPLIRYRMLHCNDIGEDYMSRCYIRAEAEVGSVGGVDRAASENWYRCVDVDALVARLTP